MWEPLSQLNPVSIAPPGALGFATSLARAVGEPSATPNVVPGRGEAQRDGDVDSTTGSGRPL